MLNTILDGPLIHLRTDADVIRYVRDFLLNQEEKSIEQICQYRATKKMWPKPDRVLACAIGCLIPDSDYIKDMEGASLWCPSYDGSGTVTNQLVWDVVKAALPNWKMNGKLLSQLQQIHDGCLVREWEYRFDALLREYA